MNDLSASIGIANLNHFEYIKEGFTRCASYYRSRLDSVSGITLTQPPSENRSINPWLFSILVERKPEFYKVMHSKGITVSQVHERNDKHSCVDSYKSMLPSLDKICNGLVCIPCGWWVSQEQLEFICDN